MKNKVKHYIQIILVNRAQYDTLFGYIHLPKIFFAYHVQTRSLDTNVSWSWIGSKSRPVVGFTLSRFKEKVRIAGKNSICPSLREQREHSSAKLWQNLSKNKHLKLMG